MGKGGIRQRLGLKTRPKFKASPLGEYMIRQHIKGKLSAASVAEMAAGAVASGASSSTDVVRFAKPKAKARTRVLRNKVVWDTRNVSRSFMRTARRGTNLPAPLLISAPLWDKDRDVQVLGKLAFCPPHETMADLVANKGADQWTSYAPNQEGFRARVEDVKQRLRVSDAEGPMAAFGLWGDGAPVFNRTNVNLMLFTVLSGIDRTRFWVAAVGKDALCQCGCLGRCTFDAIFRALAWSFQALLLGVYPSADPDGNAFTSGFRSRLAGQKLGIRGVCVSKCADWAWYKQVLDLQGWKASGPEDRICWQCHAGGRYDPYDAGSSAAWRKTRVHSRDVVLAPKYRSAIWSIPGFILSFVRADWMHVVDLGVLQHAVGSAMYELFRDLGGTHDTKVARRACAQLLATAKVAARALGVDIFGDLTIGMMRPKATSRAKMRLKAAEGRHFLPVCVHMLTHFFPLDSEHSKLRLNCLRQLEACCNAVKSWDDASGYTLAHAAKRFLILYRELSNTCHMPGVWALVPKFHLFIHLAEEASMSPALEWNYSDESAIGEAARLARLTNPRHIGTKLVEKHQALFRCMPSQTPAP